MIIKFHVYEPVQKSDGSWDIQERDMEKEYPDEAVRHNELCTVCGFPGYPECRDWCQNEKWRIEKENAKKEQD